MTDCARDSSGARSVVVMARQLPRNYSPFIRRRLRLLAGGVLFRDTERRWRVLENGGPVPVSLVGRGPRTVATPVAGVCKLLRVVVTRQ